ncbi:hypothetical protein [Dongia sp.]|uniref:hypothetical protein n=1 Tax=Dongia sp. TaxID=1977262 RepID=UPI0035AFED5D
MSKTILMIADHFYNAYRLLEDNEQAVAAEIERVMGDRLDPTDEFIERVNNRTFRQTGIPGVTCIAFATELYLKALAMFTQGNNDRINGHNTKVLFDNLPAAAKQELVAAILALLPEDNEESIGQRLAVNARAFEEFRYFHEEPTGRDYMQAFAVVIVICLRRVLAPHYPHITKEQWVADALAQQQH